MRHVASFGEKLSHKAIGVFVRAALPCTIRLGEVHIQRRGRRQLLMLRKLFAIVQRQGFPQTQRQRLKQPDHRFANSRCPPIPNFGHQQITRFPVDQRHRTTVMSAADHGVAFPVAVTCPPIDHGRTPFDRDARWQLAAFFVASPHSSQTPQVSSPIGSGMMSVNPRVDRLTRDVPMGIVGKIVPRPSGNLIGRPSQSETLTYITCNFRPFHLANPRTPTPSVVGLCLCRRSPVTVGATVPSQLTRNRRRVSFQPSGNLRLTAMLMDHQGYLFPFLKSKMTCHHGDSVQKGLFCKTTLSNIPVMFSPIPVFNLVAFQF